MDCPMRGDQLEALTKLHQKLGQGLSEEEFQEKKLLLGAGDHPAMICRDAFGQCHERQPGTSDLEPCGAVDPAEGEEAGGLFPCTRLAIRVGHQDVSITP